MARQQLREPSPEGKERERDNDSRLARSHEAHGDAFKISQTPHPISKGAY